MGICRDIFQNTGHLVIRSAVDIHADDFSHRVFVTEIFFGNRFCEDDRMNLIQRFLFAAQRQRESRKHQRTVGPPVSVPFHKISYHHIEVSRDGHELGAIRVAVSTSVSSVRRALARAGGVVASGSADPSGFTKSLTIL